MPTFNSEEKTWVILCLSITPKYWEQGIGSILFEKTIKHLKGKTRWIEVGANKKGHWHPAESYKRLGFKILKDIDDVWIMGHSV